MAFFFLTPLIIMTLIVFSTSEETCEKKDVCSCQFKNGSTVNLRPVDGGQKGPSNVMLEVLAQAATSSLSNPKLVSGSGLSPTARSSALCGLEARHGYPLGVGSLEALVSQTLEDYFVPKANVPFERHMLLQIAQEISENVDQFVCRLHQRAVSRDFGAQALVIEKTTIF